MNNNFINIIESKNLIELEKICVENPENIIKEFINLNIFINWVEGFELLLKLNKDKTLECLNDYLTELINYDRNEYDIMMSVKNSICYLLKK